MTRIRQLYLIGLLFDVGAIAVLYFVFRGHTDPASVVIAVVGGFMFGASTITCLIGIVTGFNLS